MTVLCPVICGTGHRPNKLGGYGPDVFARLVDLATKAIKKYQPSSVISGVALGWDMALASAAIDLGVPFTAAVPFEGQETRWPETNRSIYRQSLSKATKVVYVCDPGYAAWKMQRRNEWMVDNASLVLALWDGSPGGTGNCAEYAHRIAKPVVNLWESWIKYKDREARYA